MIVASVEASVALKRLNKFLNAEEVDENAVIEERGAGKARICLQKSWNLNVLNYILGEPVQIQDGNFSWEPETTCLKNINLKVKEGSLVAVVGVVGSGKSSLLSSILGEMIKVSGRVKRKVHLNSNV